MIEITSNEGRWAFSTGCPPGGASLSTVNPQNNRGCPSIDPQANSGSMHSMTNHTDVVRIEVVDRLRAIGALAEHVAQGRVDLHLALETCSRLLSAARAHVLDEAS